MKTQALVVLLVTASIPALAETVIETKSVFDGARELSLESWYTQPTASPDDLAARDSNLGLSLFWRSTMSPGKLIITAYVRGLENIQTTNSLLLNIDGEIVSLTSVDELTEHRPYRYERNGWESWKRYEITRETLDKIMAASEVTVRVNLEKTYVEGVFGVKDGHTMVKLAFALFAKRLDEVQAELSGASIDD